MGALIRAIYIIGISTLAFLLWILGTVFVKGGAVIVKYGLQIFTSPPPPPMVEGGGLANAIVGTLIMVSLAWILAFPIGLLAGILIGKYGHSKLAKVADHFSASLIEVPTIAVGLAVYWMVVTYTGFSVLAGAISLAIIMLPYIVIYTAETYKKIPALLEEGALALGIPRYKVLLKILRPIAMPGILAGTLMGVAKAAGEAAPLLFTSFGSDQIPTSIFQPASALSLIVYVYGFSPFENYIELAWAASFILVFMIVLPLIIISRIVAREYEL